MPIICRRGFREQPAPGILRQGSSDSNEVLLLVYVPLEKEMATQNSSILAWEILWTEEPGGLQSMELQSQDMTEYTYMYICDQYKK